MTCRYTLTLADFRDSMRAFRRVAPSAALRYRLDVWILPALGAAMLAAGAYEFTAGAEWWQWLALPGLGLLVILPASYQLHLRSAFRARNELVSGEGITAELAEDTIHFSIPGRAAIEYPWASISNFSRGKHSTTLLLGKAVFHTIPNRAMTPAFEQALFGYLRPFAKELPC